MVYKQFVKNGLDHLLDQCRRDQLLASIVVFESARTNLEYANPLYEAGVSAPNVVESFFDGEEQTKGVEIDLNAYLNDQWKVNINGVYQDARDKTNPNSSSFDTRQKGVPYVTASSWVTYSAVNTPSPLA